MSAMQIEFAEKVQSMLATVIGCKRYDINGQKFANLYIMQEAEQTDGSWGFETMSMPCPYELMDLLRQGAPGQVVDVQYTSRMGSKGKMAYTCVGVLPAPTRKPAPTPPPTSARPPRPESVPAS